MSEEEKGKEEAPAAGGGKKKMMIVIIAAVLVLGGGGVGAFFAFGKSKPAEGEEGAEAEEEEAEGHGEETDLPPAVLPLETFIVNLQVKGSFLKTTIQLEFAEPELPHSIDHDTPKIRDAVIRVLSSKEAKEILSAEGKEKLREELKNAVNGALQSEDVVQVYLTEFIIQ